MNKLLSIAVAAFVASSACGATVNQAMAADQSVKQEMKAPDFTLESANGPVSLHDYLGKSPVVLYFYPKDETPVCTKEACGFRDNMEAFRGLQAVIIGVSADSVDSHKEFATKHNLPFILLSDKDNAVRKLYGVGKSFGVLPGRTTFVIGKDGVVKKVFSNEFEADKHVQEALASLKRDSTSQ